ncbi:hypothetical protein YH65_07080 [Sulfurovum lithotrophicum]|uniref:Nucleotidyltransferase n=1 Tax=Sulfurovum lithotrophicum TaxID=206403 RepID=A0A7U4M1K5_9BACT|nr:nucleotidyltransferase family protein [Sulfurovum lithotrophicum]AKF25180.1 hypothetical protein YH65_07080 [Sulfurovum lithotrophicum]
MCLALASNTPDEKKEKFLELYNEVDDEQLYNEAKIDEVDSHVAYLMKETGISLDEKWNASFDEVEKRITNLMEELERVAAKLDEYNIPIVALKNAGITKGIYKNVACSPMGDIDLLIETDHFHKAHEIIMEELGYTFKFRSEYEHEDIEEAFRGGGTEYYQDINGYKVWLELQWRPIAGRWIQPENEPNGNELVKRSYQAAGSKVRILAPEDNLLQVALHTTKHSYVRAPGFRLHSDVDRIVRYTDIDWDKFVKQVEELQLKTSVYFSLCFAKNLLNTPIPENVLDELKPNIIRGSLIRHFIKKADIFDQKKKKFSKIGYILFNMSLYDSLGNLFVAIVPSPQTIKDLYGVENSMLLPFFYIKRLSDLIIKRAKL